MSYPRKRVAAGIAVVSILVVSTCYAKTIEATGRDCQTGKIKACAELRKIATTAKSPKDKLAAIPFISDSSVLSMIANDATQERDISLAAGARLAALDKQAAERLAEQQRIAAQKYVLYPNGFVLPVGAKVDPSKLNEVMNFLLAHPSEVYHQSSKGFEAVQGLSGFHGIVWVAGAKYEVSGFAVICGSGLQYGWVGPNSVIRYAPNGGGILALIVGTTEWLLPDFNLQEAITKGYVYRGRVIENKSTVD